MRKIWFLAALLIGVLNFFGSTPTAFAFSDNIWGGSIPSPSIQTKDLFGSLSEIDYWVSSSAPTNSVRYKTVNYYVTLHNGNGTSTTYSFQPTVSPPSSGTVVDEFIVTAQDLINAGFSSSSLQESNFSNISLSATIEIYNASTGAVYTTFGNANSTTESIYPVIDQVGATYGFGTQDTTDMKTRYADTLPLPGSGSGGGSVLPGGT